MEFMVAWSDCINFKFKTDTALLMLLNSIRIRYPAYFIFSNIKLRFSSLQIGIIISLITRFAATDVNSDTNLYKRDKIQWQCKRFLPQTEWWYLPKDQFAFLVKINFVISFYNLPLQFLTALFYYSTLLLFYCFFKKKRGKNKKIS